MAPVGMLLATTNTVHLAGDTYMQVSSWLLNWLWQLFLPHCGPPCTQTSLLLHTSPPAPVPPPACRLAARGSKSADLFKKSGGPDTAALTQHLDKLNQLEAQQGGKEGAGGAGGGEGEGDDGEPVDVVHDEDDDDVMEEDDYYQVGEGITS